MIIEAFQFLGAVLVHLVFVFFIQSAVRDAIHFKKRWVDAVFYSILYTVFIDFMHFEWGIIKGMLS